MSFFESTRFTPLDGPPQKNVWWATTHTNWILKFCPPLLISKWATLKWAAHTLIHILGVIKLVQIWVFFRSIFPIGIWKKFLWKNKDDNNALCMYVEALSNYSNRIPPNFIHKSPILQSRFKLLPWITTATQPFLEVFVWIPIFVFFWKKRIFFEFTLLHHVYQNCTKTRF